MKPVQVDQQALAQFGVQGGKGLVQQKHLRFVDQGTGDCDPLFLPTAEHRRLLVDMLVKLDHMHILPYFLVYLVFGELLDTQRKGDVLVDGQVGEERVCLEDRVGLALVRGKVDDTLAIEADVAGVWKIEAGDDAKQRGLPAAGRAEQREELALLDLDVHMVESRKIPVGPADIPDGNWYAVHCSYASNCS